MRPVPGRRSRSSPARRSLPPEGPRRQRGEAGAGRRAKRSARVCPQARGMHGLPRRQAVLPVHHEALRRSHQFHSPAPQAPAMPLDARPVKNPRAPRGVQGGCSVSEAPRWSSHARTPGRWAPGSRTKEPPRLRAASATPWRVKVRASHGRGWVRPPPPDQCPGALRGRLGPWGPRASARWHPARRRGLRPPRGCWRTWTRRPPPHASPLDSSAPLPP